MKPITRKRALELAMECVRIEMTRVYPRMEKVNEMRDHYAELAAALAWLETASRQKEMHL